MYNVMERESITSCFGNQVFNCGSMSALDQQLTEGAASSMPQNVLALSLLLTNILCNSTSFDYGCSKEASRVPFEYLTEPIAQVTDRTEASEKLVQHTREEFLEKEIVKVGDNIYVAIGYALGNSIMIEGTNGIIIVDTTESEESMVEIMEEFRNITDKPVMAIILTHFHTDHILGTSMIIAKETERRPRHKIDIYAHETTAEQMTKFAETYEIGMQRAVKQFGPLIPKIPGSITGSGIGPFLRFRKKFKVFIPTPTVTFKDQATYNVAGVRFNLIFTPGETSDQITVWLPDELAVLPADNIYKAFPNIYAIRGTPTRCAKLWYSSLDRTLELGAHYLIGSHGQPIFGKEAVRDALLTYRDAIKYVHDQTLRLINKGYYPGQIVEKVKLPDRVADHPFLQEHYGTVDWSIRGIFTSYMGWFSGDPKELHPMTESQKAGKLLELVEFSKNHQGNPAEILLQNAQQSHEKSYLKYLRTGKHDATNDKWALEIVDALLEKEELDGHLTKVANHIKISALRALGTEEISANGRNYYLTEAMQLENGKLSTKMFKNQIVKTSEIRKVLYTVCGSVDGLKCQYKNYTAQFEFIDTKNAYVITLRNSVCDIYETKDFDISTNQIPIHVFTTSSVFKSILLGESDTESHSAKQELQFYSGSTQTFKNFLSCFDLQT